MDIQGIEDTTRISPQATEKFPPVDSRFFGKDSKEKKETLDLLAEIWIQLDEDKIFSGLGQLQDYLEKYGEGWLLRQKLQSTLPQTLIQFLREGAMQDSDR